MMKNEFEKLAKLEVTAAEWVEIETQYLAANMMAKQDFCTRWKRVSRRNLLDNRITRLQLLENYVRISLRQRIDWHTGVAEKEISGGRIYHVSKAAAFEECLEDLTRIVNRISF